MYSYISNVEYKQYKSLGLLVNGYIFNWKKLHFLAKNAYGS